MSNATHDLKHADKVLQDYVTVTVMNIITTFFSSPFAEQSTTVQVKQVLASGLSSSCVAENQCYAQIEVNRPPNAQALVQRVT